MSAGIHISLAAEPVFRLLGVPITNSVLSTWVIIVLVALFGAALKQNLQLVPRGFQHVIEGMVEWLYETTRSIIPDIKLANRLFPLLLTFFVFILLANWFGLLPFVGPITVRSAVSGEAVPLFRAPTSDLTTTAALAVISVTITHILGLQALGVLGYLKKYFNWNNPMNALSGFLELISEFSKLVAFTFRLFGNIFAGEVLIAVMTLLLPYLIPSVFIGLEVFVGFIQAYVFTILTAVFISLAMTSHAQEAT